MSKILWIGDAAVSSGFGRCTEQILAQVTGHEIAILGINYHGDPHPMQAKYRLYPAQQPGSHPLGMHRLRYVIETERPDVIVMQTNPWNVPAYLKVIKQWSDAKTIGVIAVEGKNLPGRYLKDLDHCIFWTEFGLNEARKGGWKGNATVIPLGVDLEQFSPGGRMAAREKLQLPADVKDGFIVLNVNRNQHRKRLDLSILAFAKWVREYNVPDAFLYLHAMQGSTVQLNVDDLTGYAGIPNRVILAEPVDVYQGASHAYLLATFRAADVGLSTSLGEGWGLTTMEGMACHLAQIATDYSAVPEWSKGSVWLTKVASEGIMPDVYGQLGGTPDLDSIVEALDVMYHDRKTRLTYAQAGRARVEDPSFRWEHIGKRYAETIDQVLHADQHDGNRGDEEAILGAPV